MRQIGTALNRPASLRYSKVIERMGTRIPAALSICGLFALTLERSPAGKSVSCVMLAPAMGDITTLLDLARHGDSAARERFFTRIYSELNALAGRQLARQPQMTMLDPPALVREAYLRIARLHTLPGADRNAFMAYAARAMRSVIIDYLR